MKGYFLDMKGFSCYKVCIWWWKAIRGLYLYRKEWYLYRKGWYLYMKGRWYLYRKGWYLYMKDGICIGKNAICVGKEGICVGREGICIWKEGICIGKEGIWLWKVDVFNISIMPRDWNLANPPSSSSLPPTQSTVLRSQRQTRHCSIRKNLIKIWSCNAIKNGVNRKPGKARNNKTNW